MKYINWLVRVGIVNGDEGFTITTELIATDAFQRDHNDGIGRPYTNAMFVVPTILRICRFRNGCPTETVLQFFPIVVLMPKRVCTGFFSVSNSSMVCRL